jgi:tetratricopeptide (TPR) repeat protein
MQDSASFWTDIKNLEEQLAAAPDSFCFARLSEVYLKVGLVDDALHIARQGIQKHPRYLSGQRAFSLACHARGLDDEALAALQQVTEVAPEDVECQKLKGRLLAEAGNKDAAGLAFRTALEFEPDDVECRIELESLRQSATGGGVAPFLEMYDHDEIIEDLEILEEDEIEEETYLTAETPCPDVPFEAEIPYSLHHDPLTTGTLAELYVSQGFIQKALEIYRAIVADNPTDLATARRVADLEALEAGRAETATEDVTGEKNSDTTRLMSSAPAVAQQQITADPLVILDSWLENIRRMKTCHY